MDIIGLHLSPRQGGNSDVMLAEFSRGAAAAGATVRRFSVSDRRIEPCLACSACDIAGQCPTSDDMQELYPLLAQAKFIVVSTSIFFYDVPAQGKALIDRSQALWVRRHVLKRPEALKPDGRGFLLALGATKGENLFLPVSLSVGYFFDALGFLPKTFQTLFLRQVEAPGDLERQPEKMSLIHEAGLGFGRLAAEGRDRTE